jgi:hypothetical protein
MIDVFMGGDCIPPINTSMSKYSTPITTTELCDYGCGQTAKFQFAVGKKCCSKHYNSCPEKRRKFSEEVDHKVYSAKSLETRKTLGITKSSQIKATATRKANGHYEKLAKTMQSHWEHNPWQNNLECPLLKYKNTDLLYQGTYELDFLEELELDNGIEWIIKNVSRGPAIYYIDPTDGATRLYISDFLIENTIYEIKSLWTWNKNGKDKLLEEKNKAKLTTCVENNYNVILVLNHRKIKYDDKFELSMGRTL